MKRTQKPLMELMASDLMSEELVLIPREMSLAGAARLLARSGVTGAPVVDADGHCVGVLSSTDFMHWARHDEPHRRHAHAQAHVCCSGQLIPENLPEEDVGRYMTTDPVIMPAAAPIGKLARMMLDAHIHRVIVTDKDRRPIGIVSATDILAAVARAA